MNRAALKVELGSTGGPFGKVRFAFVANTDGDSRVEMWADDPSDGRKAGVLVDLRNREFEELQAIVEFADCTLRRLTKRPLVEQPRLHVACHGENWGELSLPTVAYLLRNELLSFEDHYYDARAREWRPLDQCPQLADVV